MPAPACTEDPGTQRAHDGRFLARTPAVTPYAAMLGELPYIGVMADKRTNGINNLADEAIPLKRLRLHEAMTTPFGSDAHFVCYTPVNTGQLDYPRINKPALPKLRTHGADVLMSMLVIDYDNPDHRPWTEALLQDFMARFAELGDGWDYGARWTCFYTTRNGARIVYVLDEPIPVDEAEGKHRWLCGQFCEHGIAVDIGISDWTRCFRLPFVVRDGVRTWEEATPAEGPMFQPGARIDARSMPSAEKWGKDIVVAQQVYDEIRPFEWPKPSREEAVAKLIDISDRSGRYVQSEWYKIAKQRLKGRECYGCIFEGAKLAERGYRDATIHRHVGQAVSLLYYATGTTPDHIYGLFVEAVEQLEPDSGTPDWTNVLWSAVGRCWQKEEAKAAAAAKEAEKRQADQIDTMHAILQGMREWCDHPRLHGNDSDAMEWVLSHLILSVANNYFVMGRNGYYDAMQLLQHQVIAKIRQLGMDSIIETVTYTEGGAAKDVSLSQIVGRYATIARDVEALPSQRGVRVVNIDRDDATVRVPSFSRNADLTPCFDQDVNDWLRILFGENFEQACEWIAWSLAFEEGPICALSIEGGQGVGKKMLVQGLAECLTTPRVADATDLLGAYQYGLLESPFLVINEGWPEQVSRARHPADQFRALVSGDVIRVSRKFLSPITVRNPVRIIFTANNSKVVQMLTGDRDLSPEDREALAIRLLHYNVGEEASTWLRARGGMRFTGRVGRRWIAGDGNQPSDYVVARHFLWLYQQRTRPPGTRFLVEGNSRDDVLFEMRTQSGKSPLIIEAVLQMIESQQRYQGLVVEDGRLYVLAAAVLEYFRSRMSNETRQTVRAQEVTSVFHGLMTKDALATRHNALILPSRKAMGRRRWFELDPLLLLAVAERDGWPCDKLRELCKERIRHEGAFASAA